MIDSGDLRKGITVEIDGVLYQVLDFQHLKLGRGSAQVRLKLKDIRAGHITDRTVQAGTKFSRARVERQPAQYLYADGDLHHFMNTETYDQIALNTEQLGDALQYLSENATCQLLTHNDQAVGVELSAAVELKVAQTDSWVRGDTAQGGTKPARLETGLIVQVPLFINTGDLVKVDTRTGEYLGKA
ncbi:MAG: elongation factor P [Dehalococcoidia bacterium]|jgi:elongation factor P|nr:elongation factor P [Dehalococcoidia bacterium]